MNYNPEKLSRSYLYELVADSVDELSDFFEVREIKRFKQIFMDSAAFVEHFENDIYSTKDYSYEEFDVLIKSALKDTLDDEFKNYIFSSVLEQTSEKFKSKTKTFKSIVVNVFKAIANFHNNLISAIFHSKPKSFSLFKTNKPKTFLSYAYYDKGISLALFIYFYLHDGFLYVNWMWSGANDDSRVTKEQLEEQLSQCSQFLFLRTINSELEYYGANHIRQWCSWEIGNYYTKHKDKKFLLNFYDRKGTVNDLLSTFKEFHYVEKGIIK